MIEIALLGRVAVTVDGAPLTGEAAQRRRLALLALLCEAPLRPLSRDRLMLHLWPESDTESARRLLSASLYVLRKALGADAIRVCADQLELNAALVRVDAILFEDAARAGDPEAALALYGGPFLDGFHVPGSPEYDQWLDSRRQHLTRLYAGVLERCAEQRGSRGDLDGAVEAWRRLAALDPYSSRNALGLMHALAAAGNRAGALQAARVHASLLESEFDATPEPEVLRFAEELRQEQGSDAQMDEASPPHAPVHIASSHIASSDTAPSDTAPQLVAAGQTAPAGAASSNRSDPAVDEAPAVLVGSAGVQGMRGAEAPGSEHAERRGGAARRWAWAVLAIVLLGAAVWLARPPTVPDLRVIAVVPRTGPGTDSVATNMAWGIAQGILDELGRSALQVVSSGSSFLYSDSGNVSTSLIGRRLGATGVVLVSVRAREDDLRVFVELVRAADDRTIWSEKYDARHGEIIREDAIALDIARALHVKLLPGAAPGQARSTTSGEAYLLHQRGRFEWSLRQPDALLRARALFTDAVRADPAYAWAHVGLADTYNTLGSYDYGVLAPDSAYPRARQHAMRALELSPGLAPAHAALANVRMNYDWDWDGAEAGFRRAIRLNPGYTPASEWLAYLLIARNRMAEALDLLHTAIDYNPASALVYTDLAHYHYYARDFAQAHEYVDRALAIDPQFGRAHALRALVLCQSGAAAAAIPMLEAVAHAHGSDDPVLLGLLGYAYALDGRPEDAGAQLGRLQQLQRRRYVPAEYSAMIHIGLGEHDRAVELLELALGRRSSSMIYLGSEPLVDPLRGMARFQHIIAEVERRRTSPRR
jgi:DNA-binding SARP family transcriptional activator/TolB-like protein/Tfp pilus assembly protein PilF